MKVLTNIGIYPIDNVKVQKTIPQVSNYAADSVKVQEF